MHAREGLWGNGVIEGTLMEGKAMTETVTAVCAYDEVSVNGSFTGTGWRFPSPASGGTRIVFITEYDS
jgi:hypothetical protein